MAFKILVSPIAASNIDDAIKYYKMQSQSAAKALGRNCWMPINLYRQILFLLSNIEM